MKKIKVKINQADCLTVIEAISGFTRPEILIYIRKDELLSLSALILTELGQKLNKKLWSDTALKSYSFTLTEAKAFCVVCRHGYIPFSSCHVLSGLFMRLDRAI